MEDERPPAHPVDAGTLAVEEIDMRTRLTVMGLVLGAVALAAGSAVGLAVAMGPARGLTLWALVAIVLLALYVMVVGPWQRTWGATGDEIVREMPGDELLPGAAATTRVITIDATPEQIWPWLVQLGYGRGGWYSYDWIDNDGHPSARRIDPALQTLHVGDTIQMVPGMGPAVLELRPPRYLLSGGERDSWCLALYPLGGGRTRLVSRWKQAWRRTPATYLWLAITDPGAFVMEQKMLRTIKRRAEATEPSRTPIRTS
jgi:hypothetical protein